MLVVSDTTPVRTLALCGRLDLLVQQFGGVVIPMVVRNELAKLPHEILMFAWNSTASWRVAGSADS